jgi:hypothetical protein
MVSPKAKNPGPAGVAIVTSGASGTGGTIVKLSTGDHAALPAVSVAATRK